MSHPARRWLLPLACCVVLVSSPVPAAEDTLLVTGTRLEQSLATLPMAATVLTREDLDRSQAYDMPELFSSVGLEMRSSGSFGKQTSLFLRGTNSDHVLVLIDGVRIGSLSSGAIPWEHIPLDQVQRIEIVRGPRAALWGADAVGGVVQIFTRAAPATRRTDFSLGAGAWGNRRGQLQLGTAVAPFSFSGGVSHQRAEGFDSRIDAETDRDGHEQTSVRLSADYRPRDNTVLRVHLLHNDGDTQYDGTAQNQTDHLQRIVGASLLFTPSATYSTTLRLAGSRDEGDNYRLTAQGVRSHRSRFNTRRLQLSWQNDFTPRPGQHLSLGLDYHNEMLDSIPRFASTRRYNQALFAAWQGRYGKQHWYASGRWDDNRDFGGHGTGSLGWNWQWRPEQYLYASYGTAFKAPNFNELYYPGFGNAQLGPESSRSYELGLRGAHALGRWEINVYRTRIKGLIAGFPIRNVDRACIDGMEAQWRFQRHPWQGSVRLELLDPREQDRGGRLIRRATRKVTLDLGWQAGRWRAGTTLRGLGHHYDFDQSRVAGFVTVDTRVEYILGSHFRLRAKLANLFNRQYQLVRSYRTPDRHFFLSLHYLWQS